MALGKRGDRLARGRHELGAQGSVTELHITQTHASKEARNGALASGMDRRMEPCGKPDTLLV